MKYEYEYAFLEKNTVAVNSEVILDSHSLVASTLKEYAKIFLILLNKPTTRPKLPLLQIALPTPRSTTPC